MEAAQSTVCEGLGGKSAPFLGTQPLSAQDGVNKARLWKRHILVTGFRQPGLCSSAWGGHLRAGRSEGTYLCTRLNPQKNHFGGLPSSTSSYNHSSLLSAIRTKLKLHESLSFCPFPYCTRGSERLALP